MNPSPSPGPSRARPRHDQPYTSRLQTLLERRQATVTVVEPSFAIHLSPDTPPAETRAWRKQTDLADALGVKLARITNLNKRRGGANIELAKRIERQLISWGLVDSVEELNALRRVVGALDLDPKNPEDQPVIVELTGDDEGAAEQTSSPRRPDQRATKYIKRPEHDELVRRIKQADRPDLDVTGIVTAVQGTGGGGKTTLAEAVVDELAADRGRFDGVVRLALSRTPHMANLLHAAICQVTQDRREPIVSDIEEGKQRLAQAARGKSLLVLLDDVWDRRDLEPFLPAFKHCPTLVTTRRSSVVSEFGDPVVLDKFTPEQALEKISAGLPPGEEKRLATLARALTYWPLALDLANAYLVDELRDGPSVSLANAISLAEEELRRYGLKSFDAGTDPAKSTDASIRLGLTKLKPDEIAAFEKLVIFPEDARIPRALLERWHPEGWSAIKVQKFCWRLKDMALTQGYEAIERPFIQLHDHIWKYLRDGHTDTLEIWQREFLDAVRPEAVPNDPGLPWPSSPWAQLEPLGNDYLWQNLEHHLTEAWLREEWREAVCDWYFIAGRASALGEDLRDITGWDAELFAKARAAENPDEFVLKLIGEESDLLGAAHCAGLPGVRHRVQERTRELLRGLLSDLIRTDHDRGRRDHAIRALFEIGHLEFNVKTSASDVRYIEPVRTPVSADRYPLGDDDPPYTNDFRAQEMPLEMIPIAAFELGTYAITNAEMAWFVRADGYDDERWWVGEEAREWRRGRGTADHLRRSARMRAEYMKQVGKERLEREGYSQRLVKRAERMSVDELACYFEGATDEQYLWPGSFDEVRFGHPSQPVTWVCFHEAVAYCRWLSDLSGRAYSLPNEDEWEAACTGPDGNTYAFPGRFDPAKCNTREGDVRRTTPVGAFPGGATLPGAHDLSGNVWEWTASGFDVDPYALDGWLPARNVRPKGRDDVKKTRKYRAARGGAWNDSQTYARAAFRFGFDPITRYSSLGFRVVLRP